VVVGLSLGCCVRVGTADIEGDDDGMFEGVAVGELEIPGGNVG
jgi:hypothetical protein